ncbi:E3 ISG15--protein ligase herc5 [Tritrichomonas musculus]|uniref:E3 ISG15--protein ligase herc5 n=1 Tax=Tritrichomonas musculus TaxID=1915356 RepID=A0ABR2KNI4_9EUKA
MIRLCGYNEFHQLGEDSNNQSTYKTPVVCPSIQSNLNVSSIISYYVYGSHSIIITRNGIIYAIGDNRDGRIICSLPKEILDHYTEFTIKDIEGCTYVPISAVCGKFFTLYLVSNPNSRDRRQLVLSYKNIQQSSPLFLNIGDFNPTAIYGGYFNAAAVDSEGSIIFIDFKKIQFSQTAKIDSKSLPSNEKAVKLACCKDFIYALSSTGHVYRSPNFDLSQIIFEKVDELFEKKIIDISGTFWHAFAVSNEGKVFGWGANYGGRLGLPENVEDVDIFTEISDSLGKYEIVAAYAGSTHSLFRTSAGKVLACGSRSCGELFLDEAPSENFAFSAVETTINEGATFCIAGDTLSAAFIGCDSERSPNKINDL